MSNSSTFIVIWEMKKVHTDTDRNLSTGTYKDRSHTHTFIHTEIHTKA